MTEQRTITTGPGLTFNVLTAGSHNTPFVLLLHGFAESFHTWRSQVAALAAWDPRIEAIYKRLGTIAVDLARRRGDADAHALAAIDRLLAGEPS